MFLTPDDLAPFATIDQAKAEAMIEDAEAQATLAAPCIADLDETDDAVKFKAVKSILRAAVLRWDEAGAGGITTEQTGSGPFQHMTVTNTTKPRRGMFWPSEIEQLQGICATSSGAFAIDTAPPLTGMHAPWCALAFGAAYCSCGLDIAGEPIYEMG